MSRAGHLHGKTVVITGAGRGIGRAYAIAMAREGASVVVNDLGVGPFGGAGSPESADTVVSEIRNEGGTALADASDVSSADAAAQLIDTAVREFGAVDAIVNNAAIDFRGSIDEHTSDDWDRVMAVNARGTFNCARSAAAVMRRQGHGAIVNTTSGAFWEGTEGVAAYSASKAAVFSLTLSLHTELAAHGVRANCIAPNATRTRMVESWIEQVSKSSDRAEEEILDEYGIQTPENLAPLAILLCSDAGRAHSGFVFEVWGDRIHVVDPPRRGPGVERTGDHWEVDSLAESLSKLVT